MRPVILTQPPGSATHFPGSLRDRFGSAFTLAQLTLALRNLSYPDIPTSRRLDMEIKVSDYEHLGKFYLGRKYDVAAKELQDELLLYNSKDLVTHGVCLGMTGSGKTGLCITLLEEAAMDSIPAIIIDPKGDIPNLLLQFPDLRGADFRPWINEEDAQKKGVTSDEFADKQATLWRNGLESWGQSPERLRQLREKTDINVFTPGSDTGIPVSILSSLDVPPAEIRDDREALSERIESTVSSLLSLMGIDADPIQDREHILLSNIFLTCWKNDESLTLQSLIGYIQSPPFSTVGVVNVEEFFDEKKRRALSMRLNNLLASPGFEIWLKGVPLDINQMLHAPDGRARLSIFSIAHLGDAERMFFVSLLLNQMLGWMRSQSGTSSLRAILYMDEIFGFLPPTANPPSKKPLMTMLKQARAFGLGILLATQNPVDLDYKALSNIGTWFLGRLQTERDKMRVLEGLEGVANSAKTNFDRGRMDKLLAGLATRVFLMNDVHEEGPVTFHVRWTMSYLCGPIARGQIKALMDPKRSQFAISERKPGGSGIARQTATAQKIDSNKPVVASKIDEYFLPVAAQFLQTDLLYLPAVLRAATVRFSDAKLNIYGQKDYCLLTKISEDEKFFNFRESASLPEGMDLKHLQRQPHNAKEFGGLPPFASDAKSYAPLKDDFVEELFSQQGLPVFKSPAFGLYSQPGESEGDFRGRIQLAAREKRDQAVAEVEKQYKKKIEDIESGLEKAKIKLQEQQAQANAAKASALMSIGSAILGAFLGGGRSNLFSATRARTVTGSGTRVWKEGSDVQRSKEKVEEIEGSLQELDRERSAAKEKAANEFDPATTPLETYYLKPLKKNIQVRTIGLAWLPYVQHGQFNLEEAWM